MDAQAAQDYLAAMDARLQAQEARITQLTVENQTLQQRVAVNVPIAKPAASTSLVDTRILGKPDQFHGDSTKYPDWSFKLKSYMGAVDSR